MFLVRNKSDNTIAFVCDGTVRLSKKGATLKYSNGRKVVVANIGSDTHDVIYVSDLPDYAKPGQFTYDGAFHLKNNADLDRVKDAIKTKVAGLRQQKEVAGTTVNGNDIATDQESLLMITNMSLKAGRNPSYVVKFKTRSGQVINANKAAVDAIYDAVSDHIEACRTREADLVEAIDAASTGTELEAIDINAGWPE